MSWPALVRPEHCRTPVTLVIERDEIDEDGAPEESFTFEGLCNWQDGGEESFDGKRHRVRIDGRALFPGDICPGIPHITGGYGIVFGERRTIDRGIKARNPDGTVNFTEVRFR